MTTLLNLPEPTMLRLLQRGSELKMGAEQLINHLLDETQDDGDEGMSFESAKEIALARAAARNGGSEFTLEDLFSREEWAAVPARKSLGRYFRKDAEKTKLVEHVGKTDTNHAIYRRL